jgi:putative redox protein
MGRPGFAEAVILVETAMTQDAILERESPSAASTSYKPVVDALRTHLRCAPEEAVATFSAKSNQIEGLKSEVALRQFRLVVDEPEALAGKDQGPNPVEIILAGLAACQEITYRLYADALGVPLTGVSVQLDGDIDLRGFLAVEPAVRPGFRAIRGTVTLDSPADDHTLAELKATVDRFCPVLDILSQPTPVTIALARGPRETAERAKPAA